MLCNIFPKWKHRFWMNSGFTFCVYECIYCCFQLNTSYAWISATGFPKVTSRKQSCISSAGNTVFCSRVLVLCLWCLKLSPVKNKNLLMGLKTQAHPLCFFSNHRRRSHRPISLRLLLSKTFFLFPFMNFIWIIWIFRVVADLHPLG